MAKYNEYDLPCPRLDIGEYYDEENSVWRTDGEENSAKVNNSILMKDIQFFIVNIYIEGKNIECL